MINYRSLIKTKKKLEDFINSIRKRIQKEKQMATIV